MTPGTTPEARTDATPDAPEPAAVRREARSNGYWRSLEVLDDRAAGASVHAGLVASVERLARRSSTLSSTSSGDASDDAMDPLSRRRFMQLMGASAALGSAAAAGGCIEWDRRWETDQVAPLANRPEGRTPGIPEHFATGAETCGVAAGLLVRAYEGRPVKIEGNPDHPFTGSATTPFAQASVLDLYDPDRGRDVTLRNFLHFDEASGVYHGGKHYPSSWDAFAAFASALDPATRLHVVSEATSSAAIAALRDKLGARFADLTWHEWEPLTTDSERAGTRLAFGQPLRPVARLDRAKVILALDGDILADHPAALRYARDFATGRRPQPGQGAVAMNRLYAVESEYTHTGVIADHRLPLRAAHALPFALALEAKLGGGAAPRAGFLADPKISRFLDALAADLQQNRGSAVVLAGHRQPAEVHAVVARINDRLSAIGSTVEYVDDGDDRPSHIEDIAALTRAMHAGRVDTLLIVGGNPVYDAPADLDFAGGLRKVRDSIHLASYHDETSAQCSWHLPRAHYLESWGDARAWDGTLTLTQPIIESLHGGRSAIEVLALLVGDDRPARTLVREAVSAVFGIATGPAGDASWRRALHDGFIDGTAYAPVRPDVQYTDSPALDARHTGGLDLANGALEIVFTASAHAWDGRFANNGWLHETPDFATKLTWDNAALISPRTARSLGIANGQVIAISLPAGEGGKARTIEAPAYVMPGQAPFSIGLALGHGRTRAGHVGGLAEGGVDPVGFDAYKLRTSTAPYIAAGATVKSLGRRHRLATTQDHWQIDERGRNEIEERAPGLIQEVAVQEYTPEFAITPHGPPLVSLFDPHPTLAARPPGVDHPGGRDGDPHREGPAAPSAPEPGARIAEHAWGMATDLSTCIGCNACMVACQAENNVPIVGKDQVLRNREMHWIRIDRYFRGDPDDPQISHQPVVCQQCENAPCEQVCPVGATVHSDEGLNDMAYNRCVGTRYCLNNCPYRVRRFNFFDYHPNNEGERNKIRKLLFNPEVTVRSRGVMEKCTFCVQRIEQVKIAVKNERVQTGEDVKIPDGAIQTACQQACPTGAIVFGDLRDPGSRVAALHGEQRQYTLLAELNTKTRNVFLARVRNPNPALVTTSGGGDKH